MLQPLRHFFCDTCRDVIEAPSHGWVEWLFDKHTGLAHSFRIVHHKSTSPRRDGCYKHLDKSCHLDEFMQGGMIRYLSFLDVGRYHEPEYVGPRVVDVREFVELLRRLTIPYYEEARQYWTEGMADGAFEGLSEMNVYEEEFLKELIRWYS